ncbi:MAG: hypothetical protein RIR18_894 [Pseudomonadota bacterium]|jgi:protein-L-isoaspartate(D-aspartate) O-methyltransferase
MSPSISGIGMTSQRTRARMLERLRDKGIRNEHVLGALAAVPRHLFVDEALASRAYEDTALPLGHSQTISQPFIVARMIEVLLEGRQSLGKTLEIGTGCGYQTAVLAQLTDTLYSIERIEALLEQAKTNLSKIALGHVQLRYADGHLGIPEAAPFDTIIVAAAANRVPHGLLQQLAIGGRIALPVGTVDQHLLLVERKVDGIVEKRLDPVKFVPMLPGTE